MAATRPVVAQVKGGFDDRTDRIYAPPRRSDRGRCLRDDLGRCRMDSRRGLFTNTLGFGAIALIWMIGMGLMAIRILRSTRHHG